MKTDFSKKIVCSDGQEREFHFARINAAAIYYHVSVLDKPKKLLTATIARDDNGQLKIQPEELPAWFNQAEQALAGAIEETEEQE